MIDIRNPGVRGFQIYSSSIFLIGQFSILAASLSLTGGKLVYTLDDPYIHLAVAESITKGGYGINPGEYASPSSSILYPFLLAIALLSGFSEASPFVLSVIFSFMATWMLSGFIGKMAGFDSGRISPFLFLSLGPAIILSVNTLALPMTGMEHSIHVFGTVLALTGLYDLAMSGGKRAGLWAAVIGTVICGTIRFEGLALAVAMCGALFALGFRIQSVLTGLCIAAILFAYAAFMTSVGLPLFPSSVMTKSNIAAQAGDGNAIGLLKGVLSNVSGSLNNRWGVLMALASTAFIMVLLSPSGAGKGVRVFLIVSVLTLSAHVFAGRYGWFGRYEVYAVTVMLLGCFLVAGVMLRNRAAWQMSPIAVLILGAPYLSNMLQTPAASLNIYQQQFQMHRFVQEYFPARVAVNDLGYVAFRNTGYVLDLWGLGSEEARRVSRDNQWTAELLGEITRRHDISYAMIYDTWFRDVPSEWCRIGNLVTSQVTSASDTVAFYLIDAGEEQRMREALEAFSAGLPAGARIELFDCEGSP